MNFQHEYAADILAPEGLSGGTGAVGAATRAKLNALCVTQPQATSSSAASNTLATTSSAASDVLTVSDPGQAPTALVPAGSGALFLTFTLTAGSKDVVVSSIRVSRVGNGADGAFSSLALFGPDGLQIGNIVTLDANHRAVFRQPFTVPAGTSLTLQIYGNMNSSLASFDGQTPAIELDALTASSLVSGMLPMRGPAETLNNSLTIGSASSELSQFDPGAASTRYINDKKIRFSGIRITAGSAEDLSLLNIIWEQSGTAGPNDITNVRINVQSGSMATSVPAYVRGREYIGLFNPGIVIQKGQQADVYVTGDITSTGARRTVEFDIHDNTDDIALTGNMYGFAVGIGPDANIATTGHSVFLTSTGDSSGSSLTPFFSGSITTISAGGATSIQNSI